MPSADSNKIRTNPRPTCLLCGNSGEILYSDLVDRMFGAPGIWSLRMCSNAGCGLCWLDPLPVNEDIPLLYSTYYTHSPGASAQSLFAKFRALFYGGYLAISGIPSTLLGLTQARRQLLHMFLEGLKPGKVLEVGCGSGEFLHRMHKLGWEGTGLDFDEKAIEHAKTLYGSSGTFLHSDLTGAKFADNSFDAVTMNHVIEHVPDPVELLKEVRRVLKPGGKFVAATPNISSFGHGKFHDCWRGLETPRHLQIFSPEALQQSGRDAGFSDVKVITTAANADTIIGASFSLIKAKDAGDRQSGNKVKLNFLRGLRALFLQYRESFLLKRNPNCGEEVLLICHK